MRYILITLLGLFLFACSNDKDTMSLEDQKREIFNAIMGKWQFNRLAKDPEFKNLMELEENPEAINGAFLEFRKDSTCHDIVPIAMVNTISKFYISEFEDNLYVNFERIGKGAHIVPDCGYPAAQFYTYTDSTLVFKIRYNQKNAYSELKRIE